MPQQNVVNLGDILRIRGLKPWLIQEMFQESRQLNPQKPNDVQIIMCLLVIWQMFQKKEEDIMAFSPCRFISARIAIREHGCCVQSTYEPIKRISKR